MNEPMTKTDLIEMLCENNQSDLCIMLPDGRSIPEHFCIEEIGIATRSFVNRDGIRCNRSFWLLQVWNNNGLKHQIIAEELFKKMFFIKGAFEINDIPIEIECGKNSYPLVDVEITSGKLLLVLANRVV